MLRSSSVRALSFVAVIGVSVLASYQGTADARQPGADPVSNAPAADTAPATKAKGAGTFEIGDLSAVALRDGALEFPNDNQVFGVGRAPEEVAALPSRTQGSIRKASPTSSSRTFMAITWEGS
jgi:hypothetical protein